MRNTLLVAGLTSVAFLLCGCEEKAPPAPTQKPTPKQPVAMPPSQATPPAPAPAPTPPAAAPSAPGGVGVLGLNFALPAGWKSVPPANPMRLAEVQVPDASGDAAKMCTIVFSTAGGDVDSNIARWGTQVTDAAGQPTKPAPTVREVAGMKVHSVELTGSYANMGETTPHQNWTMRGTVIETPAGLLFIKMTGPAEQIAGTGAAFTAMVDGLKK